MTNALEFVLEELSTEQYNTVSEILAIEGLTQETAIGCLTHIFGWSCSKSDIDEQYREWGFERLAVSSLGWVDRCPLDRALISIDNKKAPYYPVRLEKPDFVSIINKFGEYDERVLLYVTWKIVIDECYYCLHDKLCKTDDEIFDLLKEHL